MEYPVILEKDEESDTGKRFYYAEIDKEYSSHPSSYLIYLSRNFILVDREHAVTHAFLTDIPPIPFVKRDVFPFSK